MNNNNSLMFESQIPNSGAKDGNNNSSLKFSMNDGDKRKNMFASLAKMKDDQKKKKDEMTKIDESNMDGNENYVSNKSVASNLNDAKRKNQFEKIVEELNKLKIKEAEFKLNNLSDTLTRRFFWDNPYTSADLNKV